jgi:tRNA A37 N6-isopentenylltransferase MiaA
LKKTKQKTTQNQEVLDRRLDSRVDDMMSRGLVDELADFHHLYNERRLRDEIKYVSSLFFLFSLSLSFCHSSLPSLTLEITKSRDIFALSFELLR